MQAAVDASAATLDGAKVLNAVPAIAVAFLGAFMIWAVGFSDISAIHNAAHDVRHSSAFPCH